MTDDDTGKRHFYESLKQPYAMFNFAILNCSSKFLTYRCTRSNLSMLHKISGKARQQRFQAKPVKKKRHDT